MVVGNYSKEIFERVKTIGQFKRSSLIKLGIIIKSARKAKLFVLTFSQLMSLEFLNI